MTLHAGKAVVVNWFIHQSFISLASKKTGEPTGALKIFELACRVPWLRLEAKAKGYNTHFLRVDRTSLNTNGWNPWKNWCFGLMFLLVRGWGYFEVPAVSFRAWSGLVGGYEKH